MVQGLATYVCCTSAALPEEELPSGPKQNGRGSHGQYVYWITQPHPLPATIAALGLKTPDDYDREAFSRLITQAHTECGQDVLETVVFQELHGSGKKHNNCLARNEQQYRWKSIAENLWEKHKVRVNFAPHIRTWSEGVVYGKAASEHKPPANLPKPLPMGQVWGAYQVRGRHPSQVAGRRLHPAHEADAYGLPRALSRAQRPGRGSGLGNRTRFGREGRQGLDHVPYGK